MLPQQAPLAQQVPPQHGVPPVTAGARSRCFEWQHYMTHPLRIVARDCEIAPTVIPPQVGAILSDPCEHNSSPDMLRLWGNRRWRCTRSRW